jgi:hypothetical protein
VVTDCLWEEVTEMVKHYIVGSLAICNRQLILLTLPNLDLWN